MKCSARTRYSLRHSYHKHLSILLPAAPPSMSSACSAMRVGPLGCCDHSGLVLSPHPSGTHVWLGPWLVGSVVAQRKPSFGIRWAWVTPGLLPSPLSLL